MIKRNFRLIEAIGMLLLLATWGLNSLSVEYWNEATASLKSQQSDIFDHYNHGQITANVRLEAAIQTETLRSPPLPNERATLLPFQRTWSSPDVRRAWLQRTYDNVFWLGRLRQAAEDLNAQYSLVGSERLTTLRSSLAPVENKIVALAEADRKGWVPFQPAPEEALSAADAGSMETKLAEVAESTFDLTEELQRGISRKRERASALYSTVFVLGTLLLLLSKLLEWHNDVFKDGSTEQRRSTPTRPRRSDPPAQDQSAAASAVGRGQARDHNTRSRLKDDKSPRLPSAIEKSQAHFHQSARVAGQSVAERESEVADADREHLEPRDQGKAP